jgi:hypothetical protein
MSNDPEIYTLTMAGLYSQQGHYDRAVAIYRHLLAETPYDEALVKALADAEAQLLAQQKTQKEDLVQLTREWIRLLQARERLQGLERLHPTN